MLDLAGATDLVADAEEVPGPYSEPKVRTLVLFCVFGVDGFHSSCERDYVYVCHGCNHSTSTLRTRIPISATLSAGPSVARIALQRSLLHQNCTKHLF